MFEEVTAIIWDLDGTLYDPSIQMFSEARKLSYEKLAGIKGISVQEAKHLYEETYSRLGSNTQTFEFLGLGRAYQLPDRKAVIKVTDEVDRTRFLSKDEKLIGLFEGLNGYRHVLLTNSGRVGALKTLDAIGLPEKVFSGVFTADDFMHSKPHPWAFLTALDFLDEYFHNVLSVGDRDKIDIVPARNLGLMTCKVWAGVGEPETGLADLELSSVYELKEFL